MSEYSVIIPSRGRPQMLRQAIESVEKQTLPATLIHVVIDEPEGDPSYRFLAGAGDRIRVAFTGGGRGAAAARNVGLAHVRTAFAFFLDDDDLWLPAKAERQVAALHARPDCVGVTCWREIEKCGTTRVQKVSEWRLNRDIRTTNHAGSFSFFGMRVTPETRLCLLDESLQSAQDAEFYMRLARFGRIAVVPEILARYRIHRSARLSDDRLEKIRSLVYINQKHWSGMSFSERCWNLGKVKAMEASLARDPAAALLKLTGAAVLLASSLERALLAPRVIWRSWRQRSLLGRQSSLAS